MPSQQVDTPVPGNPGWPAPLTALVVLSVGLWAIGSAPAGVFYDDGIYLTLGRALAEGAGFRYLNLPGTPAAVHYPPGYPTLLAICWWLGGELPRVLLLAKVLNAALMAVAAGGIVSVLSRSEAPAWVIALGTVAGVLAVPVLAFSTIPFSEPLFLVLLVAAAAVTERALAPEAGIRRHALAGVVCGLLFLVRSVGAVVLPVGLLLLMRARGRRAAGIAAGAMLAVVAPWVLWSGTRAGEVPAILSGSYGSYSGWYGESLRSEGVRLVARIAGHNLTELLRPLAVLLTPPGPGWISWLVIPAGCAVLVLGIRSLARSSAFLATSLGLYLMLVIVWPYPPDRFVWGIWPLVTVCLALGLANLARLSRRASPRRVHAIALSCLAGAGVLGYLMREGKGLVRRSWEAPQVAGAQAMEPAVRWVRAHTELDAVVATENDPMLYLYTERRAVPVLSWTAAEQVRAQTSAVAEDNLRRIQDQFGPAFIVLPGGGTPEALAVERLWREEKQLELVDTLPGGGAVFRPVHPGSPR